MLRRTQKGTTLGEIRTEDVTIPEPWRANLRAIMDAPLANLPLTALPNRRSAEPMERAGLIEIWRTRRRQEMTWEQRIKPGANGKANGKGAKKIKVRVYRQKKLEPCATLTTWAAWCLGLDLAEVWASERKDAKEEAAEMGLELCREEPVVAWGPDPEGTPEEGPRGLEAVAGSADGDKAEEPEVTPHPGIPQTGAHSVTLTLGGQSVDVQVRG